MREDIQRERYLFPHFHSAFGEHARTVWNVIMQIKWDRWEDSLSYCVCLHFYFWRDKQKGTKKVCEHLIFSVFIKSVVVVFIVILLALWGLNIHKANF